MVIASGWDDSSEQMQDQAFGGHGAIIATTSLRLLQYSYGT